MRIPIDYQLVYSTKRNIIFYLLGLLFIFLCVPILFKTIDLFMHNKGISGTKFITVFFFFLFCGLAMIHKKVLYVNSNQKSLLLRYTFFGLPIIKDTLFYDIQFVGVHVENDYNSKDFTIKLWFLNNINQDIIYRFNAELALDLGKMLSNSLGVNMLDSTVKGKSKWIDKSEI